MVILLVLGLLKTHILRHGIKMTWFAWQGMNNGKAVNLSGITEKMAVADGFHGYATEAQAEANPNSVNPLTRVEAEAFIPGTFANNPAGSVANGLGNAAGNAAASAANSAFSGLFGGVNSSNFWLRLVEGILGIALIGVSLAKLSGTDNVITKVIPK